MLRWMSCLIRCRKWLGRSLKLRSDVYSHTFDSLVVSIDFSYQDPALHTLASRTAAFVGFRCSAEVLRQVLDTGLGAVAFGSSGVNGNELTIGDTATNVKDVFNLIELSTGA
jgi:hypothetical protein